MPQGAQGTHGCVHRHPYAPKDFLKNLKVFAEVLCAVANNAIVFDEKFGLALKGTPVWLFF